MEETEKKSLIHLKKQLTLYDIFIQLYNKLHENKSLEIDKDSLIGRKEKEIEEIKQELTKSNPFFELL